MKLVSKFASLAVVAAFAIGPAFAQTAAPAAPAATTAAPAATTAAPAGAMKAKPEHSAKSEDCSKQADAKGLHGKARKKFRAECKKG